MSSRFRNKYYYAWCTINHFQNFGEMILTKTTNWFNVYSHLLSFGNKTWYSEFFFRHSLLYLMKITMLYLSAFIDWTIKKQNKLSQREVKEQICSVNYSIRAIPYKPQPILYDSAQSKSSDLARFNTYDRGKCLMTCSTSGFKKYWAIRFLSHFYWEHPKTI